MVPVSAEGHELSLLLEVPERFDEIVRGASRQGSCPVLRIDAATADDHRNRLRSAGLLERAEQLQATQTDQVPVEHDQVGQRRRDPEVLQGVKTGRVPNEGRLWHRFEQQVLQENQVSLLIINEQEAQRQRHPWEYAAAQNALASSLPIVQGALNAWWIRCGRGNSLVARR